MKSMTGYGRGESSKDGLQIVAEIKAVNHRYSEIVIKQPRGYLALEDNIKKCISAQLKRGRIEVFIRAQMLSASQQAVKINREKALAYHQGLKQVADALGEPYQLDIYRLAELPGVIAEEEPEEDLQAVWPVLEQALQEALSQLVQMRKTEGERLREDMLAKLDGMKAIVAQIAQRSPFILNDYQERLRSRIIELTKDTALSEERLVQEAAYFAEKSCIDEELVRLSSHFEQFAQMADQPGDCLLYTS